MQTKIARSVAIVPLKPLSTASRPRQKAICRPKEVYL